MVGKEGVSRVREAGVGLLSRSRSAVRNMGSGKTLDIGRDESGTNLYLEGAMGG